MHLKSQKEKSAVTTRKNVRSGDMWDTQKWTADIIHKMSQMTKSCGYLLKKQYKLI